MQSFREHSSGYHSNQPCYQQEPHELSRLETYRMPPQTYAGYPGTAGGTGSGNGGSAASQTKKSFRGNKVPPTNPGQHLQGSGGYNNHMGPSSYSAQYLSEGHPQQKWEDSPQLAQFEQEMVGRLEAGSTPTPVSSQYMDLNIMGHSQTQCHQPSTSIYTSPHSQPHPPNLAPSPLMYPQSHLHYPQPSPSPSPYMEKCNPMPHCYKGYNIPPNSQYVRQMSSHSNLKQGNYRSTQNNYSYQQALPRVYEQQPSLQSLTNTSEPHPKYQQYNQPQQNYCLSDLPVRSPEQYYQTCSPSSNHSPARSVGRSPSYSSTPSPLMTNPDSFQYSQPPMTPGAASTSSSSSTEKLLSNPSLWSLNALTSQVENISNNVQQLLLSEALVANKKASKRSSGGSTNSSGSVGGGPMQDRYSTPQHQSIPMEIHEGGYSSSSEEPLDRGYYYFGQSRSPAQAHNNTQISLDTASSCSLASPDDMSTRSGDSGLHNLTPDPTRCQPGQVGDGMSTPAKSLSDERSPTSVMIPSPMKQEQDSPSNVQSIIEPGKENFEESAWMDKSVDKDEVTIEKKHDWERLSDSAKSMEKPDKWSDEEKCQAAYSKINTGMTEKHYCYENTVYQEVQGKYDPDAADSVEESPADLSDSSNKDPFGQEIKTEAFKSESPTASESSVKTFSFISRGDLEQDQYSIEKDDSSENASPTPQAGVLEDCDLDKRESRDQENEEREEGMGKEKVVENEEDMQKKRKSSASPHFSEEVRVDQGEGKKLSQSSTEEHMNNRDSQENPSGDLFRRTESLSSEFNTDDEFAGAFVRANLASANAVMDPSARESAIGDTVPQSQSAMPVFSALTEKAAPPVQGRDHIDHSDAKVLEPDSPQLPGKSILPSAPSWANTPPSPKKGDEDLESGISCTSAMTPLAKPEPVAPSSQPRSFGRKHARGRRRITHSGVGIRQQLRLEREEEKDEERATPASQKLDMTPSKTELYSDHTDLPHQDSIVSQTSKIVTDGFRSRMCTRSFNATDVQSKTELNLKRKPGPKPGSKPGPKPGIKPGVKPGPKPGQKSISKPGPKPGPKPLPNETEIPLKIDSVVKRKPGPKPGSKLRSKPVSKSVTKTVPKPGPKLTPKPGLKLEDALTPTDITSIKGVVGRPKGSITKAKVVQQEVTVEAVAGQQSRGRKSLKTSIPQLNQDTKPAQADSQVQPEAKAVENESKNMVLRSRKPPKDKLENDKKKVTQGDTHTLLKIKVRDVSPVIEDNIDVELTPTTGSDMVKTPDVSDTPAPPSPSDFLLQSQKKTSPPLNENQRKSTPETPIKKKRGPKPKPKIAPPQTETQEVVDPILTEKNVQGPRRKRGPPKKTSTVTLITKDISVPDVVGDVAANPHQCPTKTKVLPPRKGRGQKYEAMVQKITSPSSKKHMATPQPDSILMDDAANKVLSDNVLKESESPVQTNNTEMLEPGKEGSKQQKASVIKEEMTQERENQEMTEEKLTGEGLRHRQKDEVSNKTEKKEEHFKDAIEVIEAVVRAAGCEQAKKEEREIEERTRLERENPDKEDSGIMGPVVTATEKLTEIISVKRIRRKPIYQNSKLSFCPYVRINNSRDFSSWCAIVNKPDDAVVFQRRRKKGILRMRNPFTVAKVTPHTAAMIQGPMVNTDISGRSLTCCLCGKPANYKDLGDLCGPYYAEDSVPRKVLTITHTESFREESNTTCGNDCSTAEKPGASENDAEVNVDKEGNAEASSQDKGASEDQEGTNSIFQRLRMEAEASEHWAHENCAIWTKGVIMVAGRLYGLKEAANSSAQTVRQS
uniref:Retinoic acid induced 1 n=1 Tax=Oryzias sinensis TaxID=183150 RepID=A0A8C7YYZ6_9TELE